MSSETHIGDLTQDSYLTEQILLDLSIEELLACCQVNPEICSDEFWKKKIIKDNDEFQLGKNVNELKPDDLTYKQFYLKLKSMVIPDLQPLLKTGQYEIAATNGFLDMIYKLDNKGVVPNKRDLRVVSNRAGRYGRTDLLDWVLSKECKPVSDWSVWYVNLDSLNWFKNNKVEIGYLCIISEDIDYIPLLDWVRDNLDDLNILSGWFSQVAIKSIAKDNIDILQWLYDDEFDFDSYIKQAIELTAFGGKRYPKSYNWMVERVIIN